MSTKKETRCTPQDRPVGKWLKPAICALSGLMALLSRRLYRVACIGHAQL